MDILVIATILCIGLLVGTELSVSVFVNPVLLKLDDAAQAAAVRLFARRLGTAMPVWYSASFVLLVGVTWFRLHRPGALLLGAASVLWALAIALSLLVLVPINNRLVRADAATCSDAARAEHRKWDRLHRVRVAILVVAMALLLAGTGV